jgi:hypothetical protein
MVTYKCVFLFDLLKAFEKENGMKHLKEIWAPT